MVKIVPTVIYLKQKFDKPMLFFKRCTERQPNQTKQSIRFICKTTEKSIQLKKVDIDFFLDETICNNNNITLESKRQAGSIKVF
jgi:hypothetical protein